MKIQIETVHFTADEKLLKFVNENAKKLEKYHSKIISVKATLKLEKPHSHNNKTVEIELHIPGQPLFSSHTSDTFEEGVSRCIDNLKRQIRKEKTKKEKDRRP